MNWDRRRIDVELVELNGDERRTVVVRLAAVPREGEFLHVDKALEVGLFSGRSFLVRSVAHLAGLSTVDAQVLVVEDKRKRGRGVTRRPFDTTVADMMAEGGTGGGAWSWDATTKRFETGEDVRVHVEIAGPKGDAEDEITRLRKEVAELRDWQNRHVGRPSGFYETELNRRKCVEAELVGWLHAALPFVERENDRCEKDDDGLGDKIRESLARVERFNKARRALERGAPDDVAKEIAREAARNNDIPEIRLPDGARIVPEEGPSWALRTPWGTEVILTENAPGNFTLGDAGKPVDEPNGSTPLAGGASPQSAPVVDTWCVGTVDDIEVDTCGGWVAIVNWDSDARDPDGMRPVPSFWPTGETTETHRRCSLKKGQRVEAVFERVEPGGELRPYFRKSVRALSTDLPEWMRGEIKPSAQNPDPVAAELVAHMQTFVRMAVRKMPDLMTDAGTLWKLLQDPLVSLNFVNTAVSEAKRGTITAGELQGAAGVVRDMVEQGAARASIQAPEDREVLALCERAGFGAVMDSAARQWRKKDAIGAFLVGPCIRTAEVALRDEKPPPGDDGLDKVRATFASDPTTGLPEEREWNGTVEGLTTPGALVVGVDGEKYVYTVVGGKISATRFGEPWLDDLDMQKGGKAMLSVLFALASARTVARARGEALAKMLAERTVAAAQTFSFDLDAFERLVKWEVETHGGKDVFGYARQAIAEIRAFRHLAHAEAAGGLGMAATVFEVGDLTGYGIGMPEHGLILRCDDATATQARGYVDRRVFVMSPGFAERLVAEIRTFGIASSNRGFNAPTNRHDEELFEDYTAQAGDRMMAILRMLGREDLKMPADEPPRR